jgi:hypothetical protein
MKGLDFELTQPPYFQLEEVIDWIRQTRFGTQTDEWLSINHVTRVLPCPSPTRPKRAPKYR